MQNYWGVSVLHKIHFILKIFLLLFSFVYEYNKICKFYLSLIYFFVNKFFHERLYWTCFVLNLLAYCLFTGVGKCGTQCHIWHWTGTRAHLTIYHYRKSFTDNYCKCSCNIHVLYVRTLVLLFVNKHNFISPLAVILSQLGFANSLIYRKI